MVARSTLKNLYRTVTLPVGKGRLDQHAHETARDDLAFTDLRNAALGRNVLESRNGNKRVDRLTDATATNGSWTFGAVTKYASVATASHLLLPVGGFAVRLSFTAVRPASGKTAYLFSSRKSAGDNYGWLTITLSDAGVLTCEWRKESDESAVSIASTAITANAETHILFVFDAVNGTTRLYVNGDEDGTAVTGITVTEQPMQDAVTWYFGVNPDGAGGIVADTHFSGKMDAWCVFIFRGTDIANHPNKTLLLTLRELTFQEWPNPASGMVVSCYDFNESSGTTLTDRSRFKQNGTLTGSPTSTARVAYPAQMGQFVGMIQGANGRRTAVVARGGAQFSEVILAGSS